MLYWAVLVIDSFCNNKALQFLEENGTQYFDKTDA